MKKFAALIIIIVTITMIHSQVTAPKAPATVKPAENHSVFKGATTYWVEQVPETPLEELQMIAGRLERDGKLTPAATQEEADVVVICWPYTGGEDAVYTRPTYGGMVSTKAQTRRYYYCDVYHDGVLQFQFYNTPYDAFQKAFVGDHFGKKICGMLKKANKAK